MMSICYVVTFMSRFSFPVTLIGMVQEGKKTMHNQGFDDKEFQLICGSNIGKDVAEKGDLRSASVCHPDHQINNLGSTNNSFNQGS